MTSCRIAFSWSLVIVVVLGLWTEARGDQPAVSLNFADPSISYIGSKHMKGWQFTTDQTLRITALGMYDLDNDGLVRDYPVGIWRVSDQQLVSLATVPGGTNGTLIDGFRYVSLDTPILLPAGVYRIASWNGNPPYDESDGVVYGMTPVSRAPGVSAFGGVSDSGVVSSPSYPPNLYPGFYGIFGPNFLIGELSIAWISTTSGLWSDAGNWEGGSVPDGSGFQVEFTSDIDDTTTVTLDSDRTVGGLVFADDGDFGSAWVVSPAATERISLIAGGATPIIETITGAMIAAGLVGTEGCAKTGGHTLTLSGDNAGLSGTLSIQDGFLTPLDADALGACSVEVDGGTLRITTGTVNANADVRLGQTAAGTVSHGGGTLNVTGTTCIGDQAEGIYNLFEPGSLVSSNEWLVVGCEADGTLNQSGGAVQMTHTEGRIGIGEQGSGSGVYEMSGGTVSAEELHVGIDGVGDFEQSGTSTSDFTTVQIARNSGSIGRMILDGPDADATAGTIYIGGSDTAPGGSGELTLFNGAQLTATCELWSLGTLSGTGSITGTVFNGGVVAPGESAGLLQVSGDYFQGSTADIEIELGGTSAGDEYDVLAVTGMANLSGALDLSLINPFTPQSGDAFTILTASQVNGTFLNVNAPFPFTITYNADSVVVTIPAAEGDLNCDGSTDTDDIAAFVLAQVDPTEYAAVYSGCDILRADINDDTQIDGRDIQPFVDLILASN